MLRTSIERLEQRAVDAGIGRQPDRGPRSWRSTTTSARRGDRALWELHATYFYKGLSLLGVWDSGHNDFSLTTAGARPVHVPVSGYFVQAAYILTGETRERLSLIDPIRPFDLRTGKFGLGALEVQARFSELDHRQPGLHRRPGRPQPLDQPRRAWSTSG